MYELMVTGRFAAAHFLRNFNKGRCEKLHGHNWRIEVVVRGDQINQVGVLIDFGELKGIMNQVLNQLDHHYLNEQDPFNVINPSSEYIARYLYREITKKLPIHVRIVKVSAWESDDSCATYLGT